MRMQIGCCLFFRADTRPSTIARAWSAATVLLITVLVLREVIWKWTRRETPGILRLGRLGNGKALRGEGLGGIGGLDASVVALAEKHGGASFEELLDNDFEDESITAALNRNFRENADELIRQAERLLD